MTRKNAVIGAAMVVALGVWGGPLQAQGGPGARGQGGPYMGRSLELALEHQEELGLTQQQVAELQEMKGILDTQVAPLAEEMRALREKIRSGEVDRAEGLRQMEALRGELITAGAPLQGRTQELLTVAQHRQLQALVRPGRPGVGRGAAIGRGRAMGMGARQGMRGGVRGGRGLGQGLPGRGGAPAMGFRRGPAGAPASAPRGRGWRFWRGAEG